MVWANLADFPSPSRVLAAAQPVCSNDEPERQEWHPELPQLRTSTRSNNKKHKPDPDTASIPPAASWTFFLPRVVARSLTSWNFTTWGFLDLKNTGATAQILRCCTRLLRPEVVLAGSSSWLRFLLIDLSLTASSMLKGK